MATPRDKFMELRKSGVDAQTARKQAYGDITPAPIANAPVAGQAPAITPLPNETPAPTQPNNQQIRENNQARVQADIALGERPTVGQQATPPQAPEIIPQAQIQTAQANPKGGAFAFENSTSAQNPENLAWVQQQVDSGKMTKDQAWEKVFAERVYGVDKNPATISQQLQDMSIQKPIDIPKQLSVQDQATIDRMTAEGRFGAPTPETQPLPKAETTLIDKSSQKAPATVTEVPPQPVTIGDMYNNIVNRIDVPPEQKALPTYKIAQNRYNKASLYSGMTESQLSNEMKSGKLIEGSTAWEDIKAMNPKLAKKTQDLNNVNNVKPEIFTYVNNPDGTTTKKNNLADTFVTDYEDNYGDIVRALRDIYNPDTAQQIKDAIYTPEVKQAEEKATAIEEEMNALSDQIENIDKEVEEEFKGSGATGSRKALEKSSRTDKLNKDYNSLLKRYTSYANTANNLITQNTDIYNSTQAQKAQMQQALAGVATKQFETELATQQKIREQQIADQLAVQAQNDPSKAIPALIEQYTKLGVPMQRSTQEMIAEAQNEIANGGTLAGYLTKLQQTIQGKESYQAIIAKQSGTEWQSTNITRYNPSTGANESTPIFYRKKTSGGFEAVDLAGNPIDASILSGTGTGGGVGTIPASFTGDTTSYIASKEGFRGEAYQDSGGVWTIGYGATKINGKPVQPGQKISQADAQKVLQEDISRHSNWKNYIDESTLSDSQKTALASFEFNLGPGIWDKSAMNIIDMIKSGDLQGAGKEMQKYNQAGGQVIKGLQNRRAEESSLLQSTGASNIAQNIQSNPLQIKEFEAYNGTTIPAQYKTPLEQDDFIKRYNEWRASRPGKKIETGNDILNIRLDKGGTEGEKVSQSYTSRMLNAVNNLMPLEKKFLELGTGGQIAQTYLPSLLKSSDQKKMDAEKKNFITAVLRKQSGASIAPSEFVGEEIKYFPQPGDSRDVVIAKQNARNAEIKAMLATAGTDAEGNSLSTYYNPPVIVDEIKPLPTNNIETLKKNYFTTP